MGFLAHSSSNWKLEEKRTPKKLSKEARRELSLSNWPSVMEGLQLVQKIY